MKALQLHYTSCRRGRSGSAGFQVRTLTPGIAPDEQREIERRGVYRPPRDAPEESGTVEMAGAYPVALRFYTLESGRRALTRSCYSGRDYSGRWGNYFAHTLVFEDGSAPPLWPIDYYEWPGWKDRLEPAEDSDEEPPALPPVDLGDVEPAESFRLEEVSEFLREEAGRPELLARMGRAVLLGLEDSRALVVRDTPANNPYWIASVEKLFPPRHAAALSTSSYQEDPRDCAAVNATAGETDFTFGDAERRYQYYMFDLTTGRHSEVPDASDYPAAAARWLAEDPAELDRFFEFTRLFDHGAVEPELLSALHLFELSRGRDRHLEGEELAAMIRFAARWARPEGRVELVEVVAGAVERTGGLQRVEDYPGVIRFLAEGAAATGRSRHRELAYATWLRLVDGVVGRGGGLEAAEQCWRTIESTLASHAREWAQRLLADSRWSAWRDLLPRLAPETLVFLLRLVWRGLEIAGRRPVPEQPEIKELVRALVDRPGEVDRLAQTVLEAIPAEAEVLAAVSRLAAESRGGDDPRPARWAAGQALGRLLARAPSAVAEATRLALDYQEGWELLYGEWLETCRTADDPRQAFRRYQQTVLAAVPGYGEHCRSWVGKSLLDHLPERDATSLALEWLGSPAVDRYSDELTRRCLELANQAVDLDLKSRAGDRAARLVAETAARHKVELRPDKPALRRAMAAVGKARTEADLGLDALKAALEGVDTADYQRFLAAFLQPALELTGAKETHRRVLVAVLRTEHAAIFEKAYRGFFRAQRKSRWPESMQGALKLWLWLDADQPADRDLARFEKAALGELIRALSRLSARRYDSVRKRTCPRLERVASRWRRVQTAVEDRRRGPLARLRGFFTRGSAA